MPPSGQTITAMSTGDVSLAYHEISGRKSFHVVTNNIDDTSKLVTDGHRHWNGFLRPVIPVVDVHVGTADRRLQDPDQHVIAANFWDRNVFQPQAWLSFGLHNGLHHFLHTDARPPRARRRAGGA